ncbi:MAG: efflux RND transporter permease subunit, partial [bacterium]
RWVSYEYRGPYKLGKKFHEAIIASTEVPNGYFVEPGEYRFMTEEQTKQIYFVLAISILLVFMITAALFESLSQPFVIMLTVPLALVGVFLAFFFTDTPFERSAYIGVILLGGIVVNNAIILVDHINRLRRQNMDLIQATVGGCTDRARPILMTTATTVTGLLPLLFFTKSGETIWYALALATIGGMTTSAFFTLTIIPVLYVVSYKIKERIILKLKATA